MAAPNVTDSAYVQMASTEPSQPPQPLRQPAGVQQARAAELCSYKVKVIGSTIFTLTSLGCAVATLKSQFVNTGIKPLARVITNSVGYASFLAALSFAVPLRATSTCEKVIKISCRTLGTIVMAGASVGPNPDENYIGGLAVFGPVIAFAPEFIQACRRGFRD